MGKRRRAKPDRATMACSASFDRFNHDMLMGLVAKCVADPRILKLVRGLLTCGVIGRNRVFAAAERAERDPLVEDRAGD